MSLLLHHSVADFHLASLMPHVLTSLNHRLVFLFGFAGGGLHCLLRQPGAQGDQDGPRHEGQVPLRCPPGRI